MVIRRLLVVAFLSTASFVQGSAQSSSAAPPGANPFQSQWPQKGTVPSLQQKAAPGQSDPFQLRMAPGARRWMVVPGNRVLQSVAPEACYAIRSYNFSKQEPGSDATRFTGASTCQLVSSAKLKEVVDPRVAVAR